MGSNENPQNIIRSWGLQQSFNSGRIIEDKLVPPAFGRIRSLFVGSWREQALDSTLDWGKNNVSVYLPESLLVLQSAFLKIKLPANSGAAAFKSYPGIHAVKSFRIMSAGTEVYTANVKQHLVDYCQSLTSEQLKVFGETYLGHQGTMTDAARVLLIPILLFNSAYLGRAGHNSRGHGIFPAYLGQTRLEIQISMNAANFVSSATGEAPASISNECSILYHTAEMSPQNVLRYSDLRGSYAIINRRFTELTSGFRVAAAATETSWTLSQPQGTCVEIMLLAYANNSDESRFGTTFVRPTSFRVEADNIIQKNLDSKEKIEMELYTQGFVSPDDVFNQPARLCFGAHSAEADHKYTGGYNMTLASNISFIFTFAVAVKYKLVAVQYQRVKIDANGAVRAYLD